MRKRSTIAVITLGLLAASTHAQAQLDEQKKLMAKRSAEADAYRKLAQAVYGLQLNSRTFVKDFVAESDSIRGDVDTMIRGIRLAEAAYFDDGTCEVPAEVTVAKVVEVLRESHRKNYKGDEVNSGDFESITKRSDKSVLRVVGSGVAREDLPPGLPEGVAEQLGGPQPPSLASGGRTPIPEIWRKAGAQARLMALEAARKDAQRRLAERIKGLRLTAHTTVRDFAAEGDSINTDLSAFLIGAQEVGQYLHDRELIAEVRMQVPTSQVIEQIKTLHSRYYKGDDVRGSDLENNIKSVVHREFAETGMGVPPPPMIKRYVETAEPRVPEWASGPIEAEGQATDPEIGTPQGKLRALRAAEIDAKRKLGERIAGLQIESRQVRDVTAKHDYMMAEMNAVIVDAAVTSTRLTGDTAIVTIQTPGMRVWSVVNDEPRGPGRQ